MVYSSHIAESCSMPRRPPRKGSWPSGFLESFAGTFDGFEPPTREAADATRDRRLGSLFDDPAAWPATRRERRQYEEGIGEG
jgi:hypothetical protein